MPEEKIMSEKKVTKFNKLYTGMKPFKRKNLMPTTLGYMIEQINRPIPTIHNGEIIR